LLLTATVTPFGLMSLVLTPPPLGFASTVFEQALANKQWLVAGACNVPNALIVPFRIELHRPAI